ncbi:hypothetical protein C362_02432 [Cryptococcus neoformans Bt1]|nr:hypothetical protein C362_02432 [Cryptococcus neoformans var. grubii Bt1]OXG26708.1 hypothetical protein C367_02733 [Cryptococcus neoformans var. grubii Ze90-1]
MLRVNGSDEYINQTQVDSMRPLLGNFWNNSISWTTTLGSWTSIYFNGTSISAFGLAGPEQGRFTAILDGEPVGSYTAQQDNIDYHNLLYNATNLQDGYTHNLTFINIGNQSFAFDYAIIEESVYSHISDNTAELNSVTTSNPFATATAKATTELSPSFNDAAAVAAQSSSAQLSALSQQMYHVKWNGAMYFVVIFASIMGAALLLWLSQFILKKRLRKKEREPARRRSDIIAFDESKFKRTTKLLEALRGKNISHPTEAGEGGYDPLKE